MSRQPIRLVTYAWGQQYIDKLLTYTLASVLAPGNLPALTKEFDCSVVVVTEVSFFDYIEAHPIVKQIQSICTVHLLPLDELIGEPWQYGISLAYALFHGFAELGLAMTQTYILFLNADFVLADNSYKNLIPYLQRGERVLLAPSYCTVAEQVAPLLERRRNPRTQLLAIPSRELARMIIDYRHNTILAKTINQNKFHFEYMDQVYWRLDNDTLLARQMPISLVALQPEVALTDINTFWDWGIVYEFCPSRRLTVVGDSDEFLMLELRDENTHRDLIRPGPTTPKAAASRITGFITQYQLDASRFPLTLHAEPLPGGVERAHCQLQAFLDELIKSLPSTPADHRNHEQWRYHKEHLRQYHEARRLAAELSRLEEQRDRERLLISRRKEEALQLAEREFTEAADRLAAQFDPAIAALRTQLNMHSEPADPATSDQPAPEPVTVLRLWRRPDSVKLTRIRKALLGDVPRTRPWHPLHLAYRDIMRALAATTVDKPVNVLLVGTTDSPFARYIGELPGDHFCVSAASLLSDGFGSRIESLPSFDLCIIELSRADFSRVGQLHRAAAQCLCKGGKVLMYWINFAGERGAELERDFVPCITLPSPEISVSFVSSGPAQIAVRLAQSASARTKARYRASACGALLAAAGCALFASFTRYYVRSVSLPSPGCLSMAIEIHPEREAHRLVEMPLEASCGTAMATAGVALD